MLVFCCSTGWSASVEPSDSGEKWEFVKVPASPVPHLTAGLLTSRNELWLASEGKSVYRCRLGQDGVFTDMGKEPGFVPCDDFRCLAEDVEGRIWVGTGHAGVVVWNGKQWGKLDRSDGFPGNRVNSISVSSVSGDVALASNGGIAVYRPSRKAWLFFDRSHGLPEDQAMSLSYRDGVLYAAFGCEGVAEAKEAEDYSLWTAEQAPHYRNIESAQRYPRTGAGDGLPSNLCNFIVADRERLLLGTTGGLGVREGGGAWSYIRGKDYEGKNKGLIKPVSTVDRELIEDRLLPEDYVSCAAAANGGYWLGFRSEGAVFVESPLFKPGKRVKDAKSPKSHFVTSFVVFPNGSVWCTTYGAGLRPVEGEEAAVRPLPAVRKELPVPVASPRIRSREAIVADIAEIERTPDDEKMHAVYVGDDWHTKGDWPGSYGRVYANLAAVEAPVTNGEFFSSWREQGNPDRPYAYRPRIVAAARMGCLRTAGDTIRHWIHWLAKDDNMNVLYYVKAGVRREAEWDDHGEAYPRTQDGPDVWAAVKLGEEGLYDVSLYFYSPNGRDGSYGEYARDYLVEVREFESRLDERAIFDQRSPLPEYCPDGDLFCREKETRLIVQEPVIARCRVHGLAGGGVYKTFRLRGGRVYYFRVVKNGSMNTLLNAVFVERVDRKSADPRMSQYTEWHGGVDYLPGWMLDAPGGNASMDYQRQELRELLYFLKPKSILCSPERVRLWTEYAVRMKRIKGHTTFFASIIAEHLIGPRPPERRKAIADAVATSWRELQLHAPGNYSGTLNPGSPRTVPFGYPDINHLHQLRVDIRPYMQGSGVKPAIPVAEMKKILLVLDRFSWDELRSMSEKGIDTARYPELAPLVPLLNTWPMDGSLSDESNTISPVKNN